MSVPDPNKMRGTGGPTCRWLLFGFDDVPPYYLICFVTLGLHVRPCFRFVKRQCVVNAIPFDDGDIFGSSRSLYVFDPSESA